MSNPFEEFLESPEPSDTCACPFEGRFGEYITEDGHVVRYFQSNCSEEAIIHRMLACQPEYPDPEEERRLFNFQMRQMGRIDGYRARRELGDKLVNLGRKVNYVPDKSKHW